MRARTPTPRLVTGCLLGLAVLAMASPAPAQSTEYRLDDSGRWVEESTPAPGSDEAVMARARRFLADGEPGEASSMLTRWIERKKTTEHPLLPEAYLLRGDARVARDAEYQALYDYEKVITAYPGSDHFTTAVNRELEIALLYADGLKLKLFGFRVEDSGELAVELLIRVQERLPDSAAAERAAIALADFYYEGRQMKLAQEAYSLYLENFPGGQHVMHAMSRQIFANVALFKGPQHDASSLLNASEQINRFTTLFPAEAERLSLESLDARIDESQGAQMLETARWYRKRNDPTSERLTLRRLVAKHPQSVSASKALQILEERGWLLAEPAELPAEGEMADDAQAAPTEEDTSP